MRFNFKLALKILLVIAASAIIIKLLLNLIYRDPRLTVLYYRLIWPTMKD